MLLWLGMQVEDPSRGMAGSSADPTALLRIYMKRGRLEDAATLALTHLHAWETQVTTLSKPAAGVQSFLWQPALPDVCSAN